MLAIKVVAEYCEYPASFQGSGVHRRLVSEFIDPVFVKTSPKRSFSVIQNERFGLVFVKTGSIISGIGASAVIVTYCHVGALRFKNVNNFFKHSLAILGCVTISVYVSEQMWDLMTETKLPFKDDIGSCTEAKFIVPDWGIL